MEILPCQSSVDRRHGIIVVHVLEGSSWCCLTEINELKGAVRCSDKHEPTTTDTAMVHCWNSLVLAACIIIVVVG